MGETYFYPDCAKCNSELVVAKLRSDAIQTFRFDGALGHYSWNVTEAVALAGRHQNRVRVFSGTDLASLIKSAVHCYVDEGHVRHIPAGGVGVLVHSDREGPILIDGNHRAVRADRLGVDFLVFDLVGQEEVFCRLAAPPRDEQHHQRRRVDGLAGVL